MNSLASSLNLPVAFLAIGFVILLGVMDNALQPAGASEQGINLQHHDEIDVKSEVKSEVAPLDASAPEPLEPSEEEAVPEHSHCYLEIGIVFCIVMPALYLNLRPDKNGRRHQEAVGHVASQQRSHANTNAPRYESKEARRLAHWNQAINNAAKASNVEKAESLLEDMYQHGDQPDIISYNSVIQACAKKGDIERAQRWLTEMHEKDIQPNTITYDNLMAMGRLRSEQLTAELNVTFTTPAKDQSHASPGETQDLSTSKPALGRSSA